MDKKSHEMFLLYSWSLLFFSGTGFARLFTSIKYPHRIAARENFAKCARQGISERNLYRSRRVRDRRTPDSFVFHFKSLIINEYLYFVMHAINGAYLQ